MRHIFFCMVIVAGHGADQSWAVTPGANLGTMRNALLSQATAGDDGYNAGDLIAGKYRLGSTIREGSLCRVRMGIHTMLDLPVAIKFLRSKFRCPMLARLLEREARATATLRHPAVVRVLDWGLLAPDDGFIVMERLEGEDLREYLGRKGTLPAEHAIRLLLPICSGVAAAHAHGIVHRDLKPENLVLAHDDAGHLQPKVLDFGIANRAIGEKLQEGSGAGAVGTLGYMPPEQAFGIEGNDPRTDVWAFCAMMYEALSGRTPILGDTFDEQRRALLEQDRLKEAEEILRAADKSFEQLSSVSHRAAAWVAQGDLAQKRNADREAARLYRRAAEALQDFRF